MSVSLFICYQAAVAVPLALLYVGYLCLLTKKRIRLGRYKDVPAPLS